MTKKLLCVTKEVGNGRLGVARVKNVSDAWKDLTDSVNVMTANVTLASYRSLSLV